MFILIAFLLGVILLTVKVYQKLTTGICRSSAHLVGRTVVVTGGNCGIGLMTARDLADRGARIIIACRSAKRAEIAKVEIIKATGNTDIHYKHLDLTSLKSVREFCADMIKTEKRLDVLINNAGAGGLGNHKTEDGLQVGMQVNYFAPFLLTCLLVPLLKKSAPSRIINVSSMIHKYGEVEFDNLNMEKYWSDYAVYANSKLFLNMMTLELSSKLSGSGVTVNALHPGISATNIFRNLPSVILRTVVDKFIGFLFQTPWEAAQTSIYLAVSPEVNGVTGQYFADCKPAKQSKYVQDPELRAKLWTASEDLVKCKLTN